MGPRNPCDVSSARLQVADLLLALRHGEPLPTGLIAAAQSWSAAVWCAALGRSSRPLDQAEVVLAQRPVFICGAPRSGTTLLRDLLDGHPQLAVVPTESQFYARLEPLLFARAAQLHISLLGREWLERLVLPPPHWLLGHEEGSAEYIRFAADFRALCHDAAALEIASWPLAAMALAYARAHAPRAERWVEKTPGHERHLARIRHDFPDALFIHLVRDPMAVLASWKSLQAHRWGIREAGRFSVRILAPSYHLAADAEPATTLVLTYEGLVADRQGTMEQVARFLEIEPSPTLCRPTVAGREARSNSSFAGPRPGPEDFLTGWERSVLKLAAGGAASRVGYEVTTAA